RPEADVDVGVIRPYRIQRPAVVIAQPQRTQPDWCDGHVVAEPLQEFAGPFYRHLDILHHPLTRRTTVAGLDPVGHTETPVHGDELRVDAAAPVEARPPAPQPRVLHAERA